MTEKTFVLHDGEDDKKTEELHEFFDSAPDAAEIYDWEGESTGISIWVCVKAGDTIAYDEQGNFSIKRRTQ